jgi:hypothetical protein
MAEATGAGVEGAIGEPTRIGVGDDTVVPATFEVIPDSEAELDGVARPPAPHGGQLHGLTPVGCAASAPG